MEAAVSDRTREAYHRAWRHLRHFHSAYGVHFQFPITVYCMTRFIAYLFQFGYAPSTIISTVSTISFVHSITQQPDSATHRVVKRLLHGARALRSTCDTRLPITRSVPISIIDVANQIFPDRFECARFKARCALAFHLLLRVGEFTASPHNLQLCHVWLDHNKAEIIFPHYKQSRYYVQAYSGCVA
jgi:hypothetical protein